MQAKFRALRSDLEEKFGAKLDINKPFGSWLIRWAGEVLTKYTRGDDGKTAWQRRRGKPCDKPIAKIGEKVLYLPLKAASVHANKAEANVSPLNPKSFLPLNLKIISLFLLIKPSLFKRCD